MTALADQIRLAHEAAKRSPIQVVRAHEVPASYEAITSEWLTDILCPVSSGARVTEFSLDEPDSGSTNRRRILINYNALGHELGLPASVFCKATFELANKTMLAHSGSTHSEVTFYNKVRPILDIEAPVALYAAYDPHSFNSIIVLRDLRPAAEFFDHHTPMTREDVEAQIRLMAKFHGTFSGAGEPASILSGLLSWPDRFASFATFNLQEACEEGFRAAESVMPRRLFARASEFWPAVLGAVDEHRRLPSTLNHGDIHLKNWYRLKGSEIGLSDWQGAVRGHWSRDVCYAIVTALTVENRRAWERELLAYYLDCFRSEGGPDLNFEEAFTHYRQQLAHPFAWWAMTLTPGPGMPDMQPEATSLTFLSRITQAADDLDTFSSFSGG
jgi:hypothetical protein